MLTKVTCPHCRKILKSQQAPPLGKTLTCRACGAPFTVSRGDVAVDAAGGAEIRPAAKPAVLVATPFAPPPLPVPAASGGAAARAAAPLAVGSAPPPVALGVAPPPPPTRNHAVAVTAIVVGAVLLVGAGVVLAVLCFSGDRGTPEVAQNPNPSFPSAAIKGRPPHDREGQTAAPAKGPANGAAGKPAAKELPAGPAGGEAKDDAPKPPPGVKKRRPAADGPPGVQVGGSASLTPELQQRVNEAIDQGVKYLRNSQMGSGSWETGGNQIGYAALPGLTLLECGAQPSDPAVQKAARLVRKQSHDLKHTYQLSLAVLFLDRLGDAKDKKLIHTLALRLVAGQTSAGGWSYFCPALNAPEEKQLFAFLKANAPKRLHDPLAGDKGKPLPDPLNKSPGGGTLPDPLTRPDKGGTLPDGITDPKGKKAPPAGETSLADPARPGTGGKPGGGEKPTPQEKPADPPPTVKVKIPPKVEAQRPDFLPPNLRNIPIAEKLPKGKGKGKVPPRLLPGRDDNSNTQFAIMALWAARRHGVPMERTLALVEERFRVSQHASGGWGYLFQKPGEKDAMTCVGLIGLAVGHGSESELRAGEGARPGANPAGNKAPVQDEAITRGLRALGHYLEHPGRRRVETKATAYFLWSVERVGVLYNLKTIGAKDWYRWGVEILLPNQKGNGSWFLGGYPGSTTQLDSCMALLFLKRANLTHDLTENLRLYMAITDPDAAPPGPRNR